MEKIKILVENEDGQRIDKYVSSNSELSRNRFISLLETGNVFLNSNVVNSKKTLVSKGDEIEINVLPQNQLSAEPEEMVLDIVYEDSNLIVINKPVGMVVHPAFGNENNTLVNGVLYHCKKLSSVNGDIRPGIVHRIDKDTSGLLVIAKDDLTHQGLAKQLKDHTMEREYIALVHDNFKECSGTVDKPIGRSKKNRLKYEVTDDGKASITHYTVLERFGKYTLLSLKLETGRTHQIRVHMSYLNHPLVCDKLYGIKSKNISHEGQMLHAKTLGFIHPITEEKISFSVEPPVEFLNILKKLRTN